MASAPVVPPEAALIKERRKDRLPPLSVRDAAEAATAAGVSMSEAGWRSIEAGRYDGPPDKLAIMAQVVGIAPDELAEIGREKDRPYAAKAAGLLAAHLRRRAAAEPELSATVDPESAPERVLQMILEGLDEIRASDLTPEQKTSLEKSLIGGVVHHVGGQIVQIRTTLDLLGENSR